MNTERVSVLGLGLMGAAIAERVAAAGRELAVWNRSAARAEPFGARGVRVLSEPAEAWEHAPIAITMLADGAALEEVARALLGGERSGSERADRVLIDMSTVGPDASACVARAAERACVAYLRSPVSGNPSVVAAGNLGLIVSGPRDRYDELLPFLGAIGPHVFHVGPGEEARVVKLALNLMLAGTAQLMAEALVLGEKHGIDRAALLDVMGASAVGSPFVRYKTGALVEDDYRPTFSARLLDKDLSLALDTAAAAAAPLPLTGLTRQLVQGCIASGMGELDMMALLPRLRREAGLGDPLS
jgi:3-hydroxyisobutyrate dehydrogenase-like beta-hydroxyacid dehydrogenase